MADTLVLDMPVEPGLELMPVVGSNFPDPERKLVDDMVDEVDRIGLGVAIIDLQGTNTGRIIDGCVLEAPDYFTAVFSFERQELNVHLDVVAGNLLVVAFGVNLAHSGPAREPVQTVVFEDPIDASIRDGDAVTALQIPDDPDRPEVVRAAQVKDFSTTSGAMAVG